MFQVVVIVRDPFARFRHSKFWIAPGHALDAHQPHALAVQIKPAALSLKFPEPKGSCQLMRLLSVCY